MLFYYIFFRCNFHLFFFAVIFGAISPRSLLCFTTNPHGTHVSHSLPMLLNPDPPTLALVAPKKFRSPEKNKNFFFCRTITILGTKNGKRTQKTRKITKWKKKNKTTKKTRTRTKFAFVCVCKHPSSLHFFWDIPNNPKQKSAILGFFVAFFGLRTLNFKWKLTKLQKILAIPRCVSFVFCLWMKKKKTRHVFAWVIFVLLLVSGGWTKPLFSMGTMQIRYFRHFRQNGPFFGKRQHGLLNTVCATPIF